MTISLTLNGEPKSFAADPRMPLLWAIRERAGLTGTKFGCGIGACGACTVHVNGQATRACALPLQAAAGASVTTIEGLPRSAGLPAGKLHPLQVEWIAAQVPQCGYCQSGMIMAAAALLRARPQPSDSDIDQSMTNICRCGSYPRVRSAIHAAARRMKEPGA